MLWVKDQWCIGEIGDLQALAGGERMARLQRGHHPFAQQRVRRASFDGQRLTANADVNPHVAKRIGLFFGEHFEELQFHLRIRLMKRFERGRQNAVHRRAREADAEPAAPAYADFLRREARLLEGAEYLASLCTQVKSRFGKRERPSSPINQLRAEPLFE
jgi:hypothetical protein